MSTIASVTGSAETETETGPNRPGASPSEQGVPGVSKAPLAEAGAERRSLLVPALVAVIVALIGGVFVFAAVGFNTLSSDMNQGFARMDRQFSETNGILLDHTDRLARLEVAQNAHTHP